MQNKSKQFFVLSISHTENFKSESYETGNCTQFNKNIYYQNLILT